MVHSAKPAELDHIPKALEEKIDAAFLAEVNLNCLEAIRLGANKTQQIVIKAAA